MKKLSVQIWNRHKITKTLLWPCPSMSSKLCQRALPLPSPVMWEPIHQQKAVGKLRTLDVIGAMDIQLYIPACLCHTCIIRPGVHKSRAPGGTSKCILYGRAYHWGFSVWILSHASLWRLEFWDGFHMFRKSVQSCIRPLSNVDGKGGCGHCRQNRRSHRINITHFTKLWVTCHHGMAQQTLVCSYLYCPAT